ncbi:MAG TPA: acetyl-CoA carboxylase, carboxyltransferase subunit beta [Chloroflexota bacterium]|nr:acetyl-CoA carboxylase, carboxyltransferase subunit beta [Chloroflexota bacterium]
MKTLSDMLGSIVAHRPVPEAPQPQQCPQCAADFATGDWPHFQRFRVCDQCGHHLSISARMRIQQVADPQSFHEVNRSLASVDPLSFSDRMPYSKRIEQAQKRTGATEAVVTGTCRIGGTEAVLAVMDFEFMGGSMGSVVGEKVTLAMELATRKKLPLITIATSGGARMQEGMLSLVQMAKTSSAARKLHEAHLPFISVLANPTTGGIYASFASLGDVIVAEPKALIGFAGPRVVEQTMHETSATQTHRAEFLLEHGAIDQIVERPLLRDRLIDLLSVVSPREKPGEPDVTLATAAAVPTHTPSSAWETVQLARHAQRPTSRDYIRLLTSGFFELRGDRASLDDPAVVTGFAKLDGENVAIVGLQRGPGGQDDPTRGGRALPQGYRKAVRLMRLAAKFSLPLITFIDTPGAYAGTEAEEYGLAGALAESLSFMSGLSTQTLAVVIGEGASGGALALAVADRVLMLEKAIYSVLPPEGAAAILFRDAARAEQVAEALRLTATDCKALGVVDEVVAEPEGGAHLDAEEAGRLLKLALLRSLAQLQQVPLRKLLRARYQKFRKMGQFNHYFNVVVSREISQLQDLVQRGMHGLRDHLPGRQPVEVGS